MGEPVPGTPLFETPPEGHLDSWKEIAAYLRRDVTTVQRWEKREGMPVHRHVHDKRGSVYALPLELDAWVQGRRQRLEEEKPEAEAEIEKEYSAESPVDADGDHKGRATPRAAAAGSLWPPWLWWVCLRLPSSLSEVARKMPAGPKSGHSRYFLSRTSRATPHRNTLQPG